MCRTTRRSGRRRASTAWSSLLHGDLQRVNAHILERMQSPVALIPQLAGHIIAAGGKRLRPMLTLASARLCGYRGGRRHIALAAAVEFIHTATLLHDDVVDASDLRRGLATANAVWGNKPSVLVGDFLFSRAFQLMVEDGSLKVLGILSRASAVIAEGEVLQLVTSNDTATDEEAYLDGHPLQDGASSSPRRAASAPSSPSAPSTRSRRSNPTAATSASPSSSSTTCSTIRREQAELGKTVGDDFRDGKITLPIVLAFRARRRAERRFWRRTLEELDQDDGDLDRAIQLLRKHSTLRDTLDRARHYGALARDALDIFRDGPEKRALIEAVDFCIARGY